MVSKTRAIRIAERIRQELSELLQREIQDPRLVGITFTDASVDREMMYADVYVSALEGSQRASEILAGLEHAQGFLRSELSKRIELRQFPRLRFHWDPTSEKAERIDQLLSEIEKDRTGRGNADQP